jgi:hypothetical protein
LEDKQRKQLVTDRRHATALIQAHNRGEIQKQLNTSRFEYVEYLFEFYIYFFCNSQTLTTDRPSTRNDTILLNMEERARKRYELKTEREAKRRAIEEEKIAKVQRMEIKIQKIIFV